MLRERTQRLFAFRLPTRAAVSFHKIVFVSRGRLLTQFDSLLLTGPFQNTKTTLGLQNTNNKPENDETTKKIVDGTNKKRL